MSNSTIAYEKSEVLAVSCLDGHSAFNIAHSLRKSGNVIVDIRTVDPDVVVLFRKPNTKRSV